MTRFLIRWSALFAVLVVWAFSLFLTGFICYNAGWHDYVERQEFNDVQRAESYAASIQRETP